MKIKSLFSVVLSILLVTILPVCASSETPPASSERRAKGVVSFEESIDIYAPVGGQLMPFDLSVGNRISAEASVMEIRPVQVRAANDGTIRALQAQIGDLCENVAAQYGALCYIDRTSVAIVTASVQEAYNKPENRIVTVGEILRVYNGKANDPVECTGQIISVSGAAYVLTIPANVFTAEDSVRLYRDTGVVDYKDKDMVGRGKVSAFTPIPVISQGTIARMHVTNGQQVQRGDVLFTLDAATAIHDEPAAMTVESPAASIITGLYVQKGQQVMQNQLLFTVSPLDKLEAIVEVDEVDIAALIIGQSVKIRFDAYGEVFFTALVKEISPMGITVLDTTKYPVTLTLSEKPEGLLPGMHATAYFQ